jgi:hypothetical protein
VNELASHKIDTYYMEAIGGSKMLPFLPILIYITLVNLSMIAWCPMLFEVWTYFLFWDLFFGGCTYLKSKP